LPAFHTEIHRAKPFSRRIGDIGKQETLKRDLTMSLSLSDVQHIANLAQLELSDEQARKTLGQLNGIFALVGQMSAVDTTGVEPLSHPIAAHMPELSLRLRADTVTEPNRREDYQKPAPAVQDGLYLVPKVIE
jgi:aspartyl-tRNA(Asn)/glutamyl-tRNA(Gln) amidotransferase subunit C